MVAGTIFELYYLSSVVSLLKAKDKSLEFRLFLRDILEKNITPEIKSLYTKIDFFEMFGIIFPISKNPIKTIYNFFENFYQYLKFKIYIKKNLSDIDIVCISGFKEFFANILCKVASKNIRLVVLRLANQRLEEKTDYIRRPILSFVLNIKNFLFGYSLMNYKFRTDLKNKLVTTNFVRYPYNRTISITDYNIGKDGQNYRLPPPFIVLKNLYKIEDPEPAILVAGDRTPAYPGWDEDDQKRYEEFLDYLRVNFKNYKLYFKPKMGKTDPSKFNLEGFQILNPAVSLEEICLRKNIKKVISMMSTSSKIGAYFGIPGYLIYPLFNLPLELKEIIKNNCDDIKSVIRVNKFEDLIKEPNLFIKEYSFDNLASLYFEAITK